MLCFHCKRTRCLHTSNEVHLFFFHNIQADTRARQMSTEVAVGNKLVTTIQTCVCDGYTQMPASDDYVNQVSRWRTGQWRNTDVCIYITALINVYS